VDATAARQVLGVAPGVTGDELRAAYRAALRRSHPDLIGPGRAAERATAGVVEAYRLLAAEVSAGSAQEPARPDPAQARPEPPGEGGVAVAVEGDTVIADLPAGDLFPVLVDVAERIGDVTHVEPESGLLEFLVDVPGAGPCSVLLSLQGRATGVTEAWCTVERLGGGPPPPADEIATLLAAGMRAVLTASLPDR
jgi:hypothetical protein